MDEHRFQPRRCTLLRFWRTPARWLANSRFRQTAQWIIITLSLGFIAIAFFRGISELRAVDWKACLVAGLIGFSLYPISLALQALLWAALVTRLAHTPAGWRDIEIFCYTHLARRIPGGVWYLAGRTISYLDYGVAPSTTLAASVLEWMLQLWAAFWIYACLSAHVSLIAVAAAFSAIALGVLFVLRRNSERNTLPMFLRQYFNRWGAAPSLPSLPDVILWLATYSVTWLIGGTILHLLIHAVSPSDSHPQLSWTISTSIYVLSNSAAHLTWFTGGLGIREVALTVLLLPYLPTSVGATISIILRILYIGGDLAWGGLFWRLSHRLTGRLGQSAPEDTPSGR